MSMHQGLAGLQVAHQLEAQASSATLSEAIMYSVPWSVSRLP
jgi:hypothetical protein